MSTWLKLCFSLSRHPESSFYPYLDLSVHIWVLGPAGSLLERRCRNGSETCACRFTDFFCACRAMDKKPLHSGKQPLYTWPLVGAIKWSHIIKMYVHPKFVALLHYGRQTHNLKGPLYKDSGLRRAHVQVPCWFSGV